MRADELIAQAGLPHPGLPDNPYHLPLPLPPPIPGGRPRWPTPARAPRIDSAGAAPCSCNGEPRGLSPITLYAPILVGLLQCRAVPHTRAADTRPRPGALFREAPKISPGSAYPRRRPGLARVSPTARRRVGGSLSPGYPPTPGPSGRLCAAPDKAPPQRLPPPDARQRQRRLHRPLRRLLQHQRHAKNCHD